MSSDFRSSAELAAALRAALIDPAETARIDMRGRVDAAVLVALHRSDDELRVVLTRRTAGLRRHAGEVSFPGGRQDDGETDLRVTALREAHEEIGLPPEAVELVGALSPTSTRVSNYVVYPFVGLIEPGLRWTLSAHEVDEVLEPTIGQLRAGHGRRVIVRRGMPFRTTIYAVGDTVVWGATARMLEELLERLRAVGI